MKKFMQVCILMTGFVFFSSFAQFEQGSDIKDERGTIRTVSMWHIMFKDRRTADEVWRRLNKLAPESLFPAFQQEATVRSIDPGSATNGGAVGDISEGEIDKEFENQVFRLHPQQLSNPIQSKFGWHLVYLSNIVDQPIAQLCDSLKQRALADVLPIEAVTLHASLSTSGNAPLPAELMSVMGTGWGKPLRDGDGDVNYIRVNTTELPGHFAVTRHKEFAFARYYSDVRGCARSVRIVQEVDCSKQILGTSAITMYEGRAAQGKLIKEYSIPAESYGAPIPNSMGAQLVQLACTPKN